MSADALPPLAANWMELRVARRWRDALDVAGLELVGADGGALPPFEAGACIDVRTPSGPRSYSLCNPPWETHRYLIAVLREPRGRGGSALLHDNVRAGARLQVGAPRNQFPLAREAVHSVLLAGGIGVTPLAAMAHALWRRGASFELHYSCRNAERAALRESLLASPLASRVRWHWSESAGRLDVLRLLRAASPASEVYVCGPAGLLHAAVAAQEALGRDAARLHFERF